MASRFGSHDLVARMFAARIAAEAQMKVFEIEGEEYEETVITGQLLTTAYPLARFVKFNQVEEGKWTGADWIWWWIDETTGEAFGAVVQAKRLKRKSSRWWIDFRYKKNGQRNDLLFLAQYFDVVPLYVLYLGTSDYRAGAFCRAEEHEEECELCRMCTLSVVPAMLTTEGGGSEFDETAMALTSHVSLEELVDPDVDPLEYWTQDFAGATDEFVRFMNEPQAGARQIAKKIVRQIEVVRGLQHAVVEEGVATVRSDAVFPELPDDATHFGVEYFPHVLVGLRTAPPGYVQQFLETGEVPIGLEGRVGGLAVMTIPRDNDAFPQR